MLQAYDASGLPDSAVRYSLERCGPPYLFGCAQPLNVGDGFMLGGQPFVVIRMCSKEEFLAFQRARGIAEPHANDSVCYVEAVTD